MTLLLGIDIGTTNWKVGAFDEAGRLRCMHKASSVTRDFGEGEAFYDPEHLWQTVFSLIQAVVTDCEGETLAGVSVTSMAESVVPIDRQGEVVFPIIPWFDARARAEADIIVQAVGEERLFTLTGLDPNPIFSLPKILWIRNHYPEVYAHAETWLQMADYIYLKLCGAQVTDFSLASRTLAFDLNKGRWSEEILDAVDVQDSVFPEVAASGQIAGHVSREASRVTGLSAGMPVVVGGHDHPCATIPTGISLGNKILDSSGTAESFIFLTKKRDSLLQTRQGQRVGSYLDPSSYAIWGGIIASGNSVDWAIERLVSSEDWGLQQEPYTYDALMSRVEGVPPGAEGVMFIPHLRGSGAPYWDPSGKGAFLGLKSSHTGHNLMRALFEGLSFQARMVIEMEENVAGFTAERLCTVGGGARLLLWQQIKADVTGKTIEIPEVEDATALGAALLAGIGVGLFNSIEEAAKGIRMNEFCIHPNEENTERYNALFEIYRDANLALQNVNSRLDTMFRS